MKVYTLAFIFSHDYKNVLLMLKNRPDYQAGLLNGIGGKVDPEDKTVEEGMRRELIEEANLFPVNLRSVGEFGFPSSWSVHVFTGLAPVDYTLESCTDEPLHWISAFQLPENVMPNLPWLIPFCHGLISGKHASSGGQKPVSFSVVYK